MDFLTSFSGRRSAEALWTRMPLAEHEYASLVASARAILSKGGGALEPMLRSLRRWRPPMEALQDGSET